MELGGGQPIFVLSLGSRTSVTYQRNWGVLYSSIVCEIAAEWCRKRAALLIKQLLVGGMSAAARRTGRNGAKHAAPLKKKPKKKQPTNQKRNLSAETELIQNPRVRMELFGPIVSWFLFFECA